MSSRVNKTLYVTIGAFINRNVLTFTPSVLASEVSRELDRPEEFVIGEVIRECEQLARKNLLWSPFSKPCIQEHTCLVAKADKLLSALDGEMAKNDLVPA